MQKYRFFLLSCLVFLSTSSVVNTTESASHFQHGITHGYAEGRFGDQLLTYLHARWLAYKLGTQFFYHPFSHSDAFMLHEMDEQLTEEIKERFTKQMTYWRWSDLRWLAESDPILYLIPYFPECLIDLRNDIRRLLYFSVDWKDPGFRALICQLLTPRVPLNLPAFPIDCIIVGVHVRKGGGFDGHKEFKFYPLKFPSDAFYMEQIKYLDDLFGHQPLYIHLFTDDPHPERLAKEYAKAIDRPHLTFGFREVGNVYYLNVVEDFIAMSKCDCLIRPESHFSVAASKIADYKVHIYPLDFKREHNHNRITRVMVELKEDL